MAALSAVSHAADAGNPPVAGLDPPQAERLGHPSTTVDIPLSSPGGQYQQHHLRRDALPETLLQLPDLVAARQFAADRWSTLGNRVFWIGIVLGSLAAILLLWNPRGRMPRQMEEAPTWDGAGSIPPSAPAASMAPARDARGEVALWPPTTTAAVPQTGAPAEHTAPAWPNDAASQPPATGSGNHPDGGTYPGSGAGQQDNVPELAPEEQAAPSFDQWSRRAPNAPVVPHTAANRGSGRWDGTSAGARPGEAVPTGDVFNTMENR